MTSFLNVLALGLAVSLPLASQAPGAKSDTPIIVPDTEFPTVVSRYGKAREVPKEVTVFKGVVHPAPEGVPEQPEWPTSDPKKVYVFTVAAKETIQVKVIQSIPRKVFHLKTVFQAPCPEWPPPALPQSAEPPSRDGHWH